MNAFIQYTSVVAGECIILQTEFVMVMACISVRVPVILCFKMKRFKPKKLNRFR